MHHCHPACLSFLAFLIQAPNVPILFSVWFNFSLVSIYYNFPKVNCWTKQCEQKKVQLCSLWSECLVLGICFLFILIQFVNLCLYPENCWKFEYWCDCGMFFFPPKHILALLIIFGPYGKFSLYYSFPHHIPFPWGSWVVYSAISHHFSSFTDSRSAPKWFLSFCFYACC